jgi:hypothetical protein
MLEKLMKMYVMAMAGDVRSPLPHLFGPPGCGKSTVVQQLADLVGVNLHIINLSRVSPLELEGVQMPHGSDEEMKLRLLHATFWTQIKKGDIVLFDEALRAFPEVFNGLLDILTSRRVADLVIPPAFFIAASNSTVSYDKALEDRLLHLPVPDPRKRKTEKARLAKMIVDALGLLPSMAESQEMSSLLDVEVLPMFEVLDNLKNKASSSPMLKGTSVRKLIGQAQLREVESSELKDVLEWNNKRAMQAGKVQFVYLIDGKGVDPTYKAKALQLKGNPRLTEIQARNLELNLQLINLQEAHTNTEGTNADDDVFDDQPF